MRIKPFGLMISLFLGCSIVGHTSQIEIIQRDKSENSIIKDVAASKSTPYMRKGTQKSILDQLIQEQKRQLNSSKEEQNAVDAFNNKPYKAPRSSGFSHLFKSLFGG